MENSDSGLPVDVAGLLDLGVTLGESAAFGMVSGHTAAARAACLYRLREEKLYKQVEPQWDEFCAKHLHMSRAAADHEIRLWCEFGNAYFEMAQLTRISAETYRAIAPAVRDGAIHVEGKAIALNSKNSREVAAAVAELRRRLQPPNGKRLAADPAGPFAVLDDRVSNLILDFIDISAKERDGENWRAFTSVLRRMRSALNALAQEHGIE